MRNSIKTMIIGLIFAGGTLVLLNYLETLPSVDIGLILLLAMISPLTIYGGGFLIVIGFIALIFGK